MLTWQINEYIYLIIKIYSFKIIYQSSLNLISYDNCEQKVQTV